MRKSIESIIILVTALLIGFGIVWFFQYVQTRDSYDNGPNKEELRKFFYQDKVDQREMALKYHNDEKIKILIVPGHTDLYPGAEFNEIRELDLNIKVANEIFNFFERDSHFETYITQKEPGIFEEDILKYIENQSVGKDFKLGHQRLYRWFKGESDEDILNNILYTDTPEEVVNMLYGINSWANENDIDLIIHIHFNDYKRAEADKAGQLSGFSIYTPEIGLSNSKASNILAENIKKQLLKVLEKSNSPVEEKTVIENDSLIALGSFNSLNASSVLIEYGFIYEEKFQSEDFIKLIAEKTYLGVLYFLK